MNREGLQVQAKFNFHFLIWEGLEDVYIQGEKRKK